MLITGKNITLENNNVKLRFPVREDIPHLKRVFADSEIWKYTVSKVQTDEEIEGFYQDASAGLNDGSKFTFIIIDKASGRFAGTSSYGNISEKDKRLEIGWSYLGKEFRGTGVNAHFKFLMLQYAFETLKMKRVEFKTDKLNSRARKALLKIGCTEEGILRSHTLMHDGRRRDTVFYSILDSEWNKIKSNIFNGL
jgi:RimJ/RimL family protein N-acetyltransferase